MFAALYRILFGTLRRQLIVGVALVIAILMSLLVRDLTLRQRELLLERQTEEAMAVSHSLATSAAGWLVAADVSGMQELVDAQHRYPEVLFAMLTDRQGKILAHSERAQIGMYLQDLPPAARQTEISRTAAVVDVAVPVELAGRHVGWARVGIGQKAAGERLQAIIRSGLLYALASIVIGSGLAWVFGRRVTHRLYAIESTFNQIREGNNQARAHVRGVDELAVLARELNSVLDTLAERTVTLENTNARLQYELAERELAEAALHKSADEIHDLYNNAPCGYHSLDGDGVYVRVNRTELAWLGYSEDELVGKKRFPDLLTQEGKRVFHRKFQEFMEKGEIRDLEFEMIRKDGSILPVLLSATAVMDESGKFARSRSTVYDISERRKLLQREHLLSAIVDSSDDAIISKDTNGVMLSWNKGAEHVYGYTAEEVIGRPISILLPPEHPDQFAAMVGKIRRGERIEHYSAERLRKDGKRIYVSLTVSPIRERSGKLVGVSTIARDVTPQRLAEMLVAGQSRVLGLLAAGRSLQEVLVALVETLEEQSSGMRGSILLLDEDGKHLSHGAGPHLSPQYMQAIDGMAIGPKEGSCGAAAFLGEPHIATDIEQDPNWEKYKALALPSGLRSCWSYPIRSKERSVLGTFALYYDHPRSPTDVEAHLIESMTHLAGVAIQRHRDTETLQKSEEKYRTIFEESFDGLFIMSPEDRFLDINKTLVAMLGYDSREELLGMPACDAIFANRADCESVIDATNANGSNEYEVSIRKKSGELIYGHCWMTVIRNSRGEITSYRGIIHDMTARKRAEDEIIALNADLERRIEDRTQALALSEHHYRQLYETMLQGVVYLDAKGTITAMNPAAERILGRGHELIGEHVSKWESFSTREDGSMFPLAEHPALHVLQTGRDVRNVLMGIQNPQEPETRWINVSAVPMYRDRNLLSEVYMLFDDVTDRRRAERRIGRLNEQLEARAIALDQANRELEAFSYSVSHDLRAPLRAMHGFARILAEDFAEQLPKEAARFVDIIQANSVQMGHLIDDLLAFSRLGRHSMVKQRVQPEQLVGPLVDQMKADLPPQRRAEVTIKPLAPCQADPALLRQVFANLLSNAFKYSRPRDPAIIEVGSLPGANPREVIYYVKDNGVGFDMQYADKLFRVFQRLHRIEEFEGTGVGLAIVQRIIHRHGGRVWAEGEVDKGATFYFALERGRDNES